MNSTRIRVLIEKELSEVFRSRSAFIVAFMPLFLTIIGWVQLAASRPSSATAVTEVPRALQGFCHNFGFAGAECEQGFNAYVAMLMFLMMPLVMPVAIAAYSIVGEKVTRSLEPLLATPVSTTEIVVSKSLAAALPAVFAAWLSFCVFQAGAYFIVSGPVHAFIVAAKWWLALALLAPLLAVLSVNCAIMISSRATDPRAAQQIGALLMIPLLTVIVGQLAGWFLLTLNGMLVAAVLLLPLDVLLIAASVRLFERETILTRWR